MQDGPAVNNSNYHFLIFGRSGSGKTSFLKYYCLSRVAELRDSSRKSTFVVFGRDSREFSEQNFIPLLQLEKKVLNYLLIRLLYWMMQEVHTSLKTEVEDLFRFGWHHNIQVIYLAHYANDVLPVVRENCLKLYLTINNPDNFFESNIQTDSIKDLGFLHRWKQHRDQLEFGMIEFDTRSQKYKTLNQNRNLIYDSSKHNKWSPEDYVAYESYFVSGKENKKLKVFLEEMSDQTIEITPYNVAFYYVEYRKQNKIKVNESKINNYVERMQQPLIPGKVKEVFRKII